MDRYLRMQTLHTATLNALTAADSKGFDMELFQGEQALEDGDRAAVTFNRNMAEAVAGTWIFDLWIIIIIY